MTYTGACVGGGCKLDSRFFSLLYGTQAPSAKNHHTEAWPAKTFERVPVNKELLTETVLVNKKLLTGTVPVNKLLLAGTDLVNKF